MYATYQLFKSSQARHEPQQSANGKSNYGVTTGIKKLYAPNCNLYVFPNVSAVPALQIVQLHFNHFRRTPASAIKNLTRFQTFAFMGCNVTHLPDMSHLVSLKKLVINDNKLVAIPDLYYLSLKWLEWAGNLIDCNKSLCWIRMALISFVRVANIALSIETVKILSCFAMV